jgi:hypothetical protein
MCAGAYCPVEEIFSAMPPSIFLKELIREIPRDTLIKTFLAEVPPRKLLEHIVASFPDDAVKAFEDTLVDTINSPEPSTFSLSDFLERNFKQAKLVEVFKEFRSREEKQDIGKDKAWKLWDEEGFAELFGDVYLKDLPVSDLRERVFSQHSCIRQFNYILFGEGIFDWNKGYPLWKSEPRNYQNYFLANYGTNLFGDRLKETVDDYVMKREKELKESSLNNSVSPESSSIKSPQ